MLLLVLYVLCTVFSVSDALDAHCDFIMSICFYVSALRINALECSNL